MFRQEEQNIMDNKISSSNRRIAQNTLFLYVRLVIVMAVNLFTTRVVLDVLGVEDYGIYNVVCGFVSMFGFLNTTMTNCIQRFYNYEYGREGDSAVVRVYNVGFAIQSLIAIVLVVLLLTVGYWYLNTEIVIPEIRINSANWIYFFSVISLVFVIMQVPYSAAVIAYERMDYYALISILGTLITLGGIYVIQCVETNRLELYGCLLMFVQLFNFLLYYGYCKHNFSHLKLHRGFNKSLFKDMLAFSGLNIFGSFAFMTRSQGVNVLLNQYFGPVVNAANGVASQVASAVQTFSLNIMIAFQPQLVQSYALNDHNRTEKLMLSMTSISYLLYCIFAIPIIVDIRYILSLWLGDNIPDYTVPFTLLTVSIMGIGLFHTSITQVFFAIGKLKVFQITTGVIICLILPISWLCLRIGLAPESVYIVTIFAYIANWLINLFILYKTFYFSIRKYVMMVIKCLASTVITLLLAWSICTIMSESLVRLFVIVMVVLLSIAMCAWLGLDKADCRQIIQMCKRKFRL